MQFKMLMLFYIIELPTKMQDLTQDEIKTDQ